MKVVENSSIGFGVFDFDGNTYVLTQDAFLFDDGNYRAEAFKVGDEIDEDGYAPTYTVVWEVIEGCEHLEDESMRCEWSNPADVVATGADAEVK